MSNLQDHELRLFVDSVRHYFKVIAGEEPKITSAYLATTELPCHEINGIVSFSGTYNGQVMVSMPSQMLREMLLLQGETDLSEGNLLDAVGEIANTLAGNARKELGAGLQISVPVKLAGPMGLRAKVRERPCAITLRWGHLPALVCIDMERRR